MKYLILFVMAGAPFSASANWEQGVAAVYSDGQSQIDVTFRTDEPFGVPVHTSKFMISYTGSPTTSCLSVVKAKIRTSCASEPFTNHQTVYLLPRISLSGCFFMSRELETVARKNEKLCKQKLSVYVKDQNITDAKTGARNFVFTLGTP